MLNKLKFDLSQILLQIPLISANQSPSDLTRLMEVPKKLEHGHLALPVFQMAKVLRQAPPKIAAELAASVLALNVPWIKSVVAMGGYLNFTFQTGEMQSRLVRSVNDVRDGDVIGASQLGAGQTVVIDYSSPNVAKPMHIGHLRSTVIGQALRNLAATQGYKVVGLNHLGDWGVQFGKLAWAYMEWGSQYPFQEKPIQSLVDIYVRFHAEAETNPEIAKRGAEAFLKLEAGDPQMIEIWKKVVELSLREYQTIYSLLGVKHDVLLGESFYNDKMKAVEDRLEQMGLMVESQGAQVVMMDGDMPPCLIRKSDGASLYATRDLASAIYRREHLRADLSLYVVAVDQSLHFKQVFQVLQKMNYSWFNTCHHISFGMMTFKGIGKLSTRKGNVILLEEVLSQAIDLVLKTVETKHATLPANEQKRIATQVGVGAIVFNDLVNDRVKDIELDWDRVLDFEGDSGPHVQYAHVRCKSILRKYLEVFPGRELPTEMSVALESDEERDLVRTLLAYDEVLRTAFQNFRPNVLAQYLLELCRAFSQFYNKHRILGADSDQSLTESRIALVVAMTKVVSSGLRVLNIEAPEMM